MTCLTDDFLALLIRHLVLEGVESRDDVIELYFYGRNYG
jgi:hypothetical protein